MATIPTGTTPVMTGTMRTGMTGMRPPQQKQSFVAKLTQWWTGLTKKQRWVALSIIAGVFIVAFTMAQINKATAYVPLYENVLSQDDLQDVTQSLTEMGIPYQRTQDDHITVAPSRRVDALTALTKEGVPKHPFEALSSGSATGETHEQFTAEQQLMLERDLTLVIRQFNEVSDADVKLVIPSETADFFSDQKQEAKAAVVLKLKPGFDSLNLTEAQSIVNLVAYSVTGLKPENVQLTDTNGRLLSDMLKKVSDSSLPDNMIDEKKKYQQQYESQIRQILDPALGPGKYALAVNVDLDWNKTNTQSQTVGNPDSKGYITIEQQKSSEKYSRGNGSTSGVKQLAYSTSLTDNAQGGNYEKSEEVKKVDYNRTVTTRKVTPGQVARITASVLADRNIGTATQNVLATSIKDAIGMNLDRGDSVAFGTLPFYQNEIAEMSNEMGQPSIFRKDSPSSLPQDAMKLFGVAAMMAIVFAAYTFYRQQKARTEKTQLVLAAGPSATISDISDLMNDKTGKVNKVQQGTNANQTEKLELLAKEKPTKVAELLKTTWLAEK